MSFVITPGVNQGYPYISGLPVPEETPSLAPPYPLSIFHSDGSGMPFFLPHGQNKLVISELYSADDTVNSLYFGDYEVLAAYFDEEEVFRAEWF